MNFHIPTAATGNSLSLATIGRTGELMGFFYPRIDYAQNVREGMPAIRLLDDGAFLWSFEECWHAAQSIESASNVVVTRLEHKELALSIEISDVLPPGEQALMRQVVISKGPDVGRVQFVHYFKLVAGDCVTRNGVQAFSEENVVVQSYRNVTLAVGAAEPFAAQCNTWKKNEESPTKQAIRAGHFGTSPQAIGRVDFAVGFEPVEDSHWSTTIVLAGGASDTEAVERIKRLTELSFADAVRSADARVAAILHDAGRCPAHELADAYDRAVISLNDLYDENEGTFIAAPEFDPGYELSGGYGYVWPRDAVICALTVEQLNRPEMARRFFEWTRRTQLPDGHWYQRYWSDGSHAPSWCVLRHEIQLDQTCAIVHAAGTFVRRLGPGREAFVEDYKPTAERATRAILDMIGDDGLHRPARDLWENCTGSFAYTQAGVIAALCEAEEVFGIEPERTGPKVRACLRQRLVDTFFEPDRKRWIRCITPEGDRDPTLDSSAMGIIEPWGILDLGDAADRALAIDTLDGISQDLRSEVKGGGAILRFQGESYMGGGPGCVNTLWLALCRLKLAQTANGQAERIEQRRLAMEDIGIALANTSPTGQLPELIPKIMFDYWAAPHAWASSLLIEAVMALRELDSDGATAFAAERARVRRRAPSR